MPLLADNAARVLSAMDEARIEMLIHLYDNEVIPHDGLPQMRREALKALLMDQKVSKMSSENADYWLDQFGV